MGAVAAKLPRLFGNVVSSFELNSTETEFHG
jgi:hypothetical protein